MVTVHGSDELTERFAPVHEIKPRVLTDPERKFKVPASIIPELEMLDRLLELSDCQAWLCGFAHQMPNGDIIRTTRNFHIDHIVP